LGGERRKKGRTCKEEGERQTYMNLDLKAIVTGHALKYANQHHKDLRRNNQCKTKPTNPAGGKPSRDADAPHSLVTVVGKRRVFSHARGNLEGKGWPLGKCFHHGGLTVWGGGVKINP